MCGPHTRHMAAPTAKSYVNNWPKMSVVLTLRHPELALPSWAMRVPFSSSKCCCPGSTGVTQGHPVTHTHKTALHVRIK